MTTAETLGLCSLGNFYSSITVPKGGYEKCEEGIFRRVCIGQNWF